jgi:hypothetical protein
MKRSFSLVLVIVCALLFVGSAQAQTTVYAKADGSVGISASTVQMEGTDVSVSAIMIGPDKWYKKVSLSDGYYVAKSKWPLVGGSVVVCFLLSNGDYIPYGLNGVVNWGSNATEVINPPAIGGSNLHITVTK